MSQKSSQSKNEPIKTLQPLFEELSEERADKVAGGVSLIVRASTTSRK